MANVVNRNTFEVLYSVQPISYQPPTWLQNPPNLTVLVGNGSPTTPQTPKKYWVIDPPQGTGTNLREMTAQEKAVVDSEPQELVNARTQRKSEITLTATGFVDSRYEPSLQLHFVALRTLAAGPQLTALNNFFTWYRSIFAAVDTQHTLIDAATTVPDVIAVTFDPTLFALTDPGITQQQAI